MIFSHTDFRQILKEKLAERISQNPSYSMRSMAKQFGVSPALLSQITNGKRALTASKAARFAKKLGLSSRECEYFLALVQYENADEPDSKNHFLEKVNGLSRGRSLTNLSLDAFKAIADWYHLPILQMLRLEERFSNPREIAARLGISPLEAEVAIERLKRLGLIEQRAEGGYHRVLNADIRVESESKSSALCAFHRQMLYKAAGSLDSQTPEERYFASETVSIDESQIPEAKRRLAEFLDDMNAFFDRGKRLGETYHLSLQLFRLTKKKERAR